jgi:hypothetical protein
MPRVNDVYTVPVGTDGIPNTTISSTAYNTFIHDLEFDANAPRPIIAGGTGSTTVDGGLANIGGEKANQIVSDYNTHLWVPGSFSAAAGAPGAPNSTKAFSGIVYVSDSPMPATQAKNIVVEARESAPTGPDIGALYVRQKRDGTWGQWTAGGQGSPTSGRLTFVSSTQLKFAPHNGNQIKIDGVLYDIPAGGSAGLSSAGTVYINGAVGTFSLNTTYLVCAFDNNGVVTADWRTSTAHSPSVKPGNEGVEILTGDDSRTVIGLVSADTPLGTFFDTPQRRLVRSWFNRSSLGLWWQVPSLRETSSQTPVPTGDELHWMQWNDECVAINATIAAASSGVNTINVYSSIDGSLQVAATNTAAAPTYNLSLSLGGIVLPGSGDARHVWRLYFGSNSSAYTVSINVNTHISGGLS